MPKFWVDVPEVWYQSYIVEAATVEEAKEKAISEGELQEDSFSFDHIGEGVVYAGPYFEEEGE